MIESAWANIKEQSAVLIESNYSDSISEEDTSLKPHSGLISVPHTYGSSMTEEVDEKRDEQRSRVQEI